MKRRWIVIIFAICFGMGMLLPVHAQEKDKIWAGTNSKIEKIEEALYKDFDDDVKEYQSGHSNDVAECQVCRYQEHISNTKIGEPYIECYGFN